MSQRDPVTEILMRPFAEEEIASRRIGGGRQASYVAGETVIRRLIEATSNQYSVKVSRIEQHPWPERLDKDTGEMVPQILWTACVDLTIPDLGSREHMGVQVSDFKAGAEDVIKGVITDALKKAATLFGVALELYDKPMASGSNNDRAGDTKQANDLAEWRKRVDQVIATNTLEQWNELFNAAGRQSYRWIELIEKLKSITQVERVARVVADRDMYTPPIEEKLFNRKKQLEKQGAPAGK